MSGKIKCIFFSEFHPSAGPKIAFQVPEDYLTKEHFDELSKFIITKPQLMTRLITVTALGEKIVGCPVCIEDKKYNRNELIFNCCFVFDTDTRTARYEPVVKKLASYFTQLELESSFLSTEVKKETIPRYLQEIRDKLNFTGSCGLFINEFCTINLKLSPTIEDPKPVQDHDVPVFIHDKPRMTYTKWDLTTQQVLQYIDGYNHVAKIAAEADIEINLVKACLQNLLHIDVITIVSIFQYSNMYTTTNTIKNLADDPQLQEDCLKYVASKARVKPNFRDVFLLYTSLAPGLTVKDLCLRFNIHSLKIDEKKLIQFGLKNKIIRRLHGYPVKLPSDVRLSPKVQSLSKWLNGTHSLDEISCKSGLNYKELDEIIENDPSVIVCWK
ncbi:GATOR1 complex protein NPRL2-like [Ruditapes philippinarum]|uniref:GATOR1 complex protein NPRL2-like n=1 Tax=Ruditapes philippinarum TaxID=129788 RepID=UPI00295C14F4|nr:GATOR1 complex protein NPRL2-like [Ruditapes philippinarum]